MEVFELTVYHIYANDIPSLILNGNN